MSERSQGHAQRKGGCHCLESLLFISLRFILRSLWRSQGHFWLNRAVPGARGPCFVYFSAVGGLGPSHWGMGGCWQRMSENKQEECRAGCCRGSHCCNNYITFFYSHSYISYSCCYNYINTIFFHILSHKWTKSSYHCTAGVTWHQKETGGNCKVASVCQLRFLFSVTHCAVFEVQNYEVTLHQLGL